MAALPGLPPHVLQHVLGVITRLPAQRIEPLPLLMLPLPLHIACSPRRCGAFAVRLADPGVQFCRFTCRHSAP